MADVATNRYLEGAYAPVHEELTAHDLPVTGTLPPELDGRYLRNGPNPFADPDPASYHWFTGDGMVHGLRLRDGKAEWYRNRWIRSTAVSAALGEEPVPGSTHTATRPLWPPHKLAAPPPGMAIHIDGVRAEHVRIVRHHDLGGR